MSSVDPLVISNSNAFLATNKKKRYAARGTNPGVLAKIYKQETNIVIWERNLSDTLKQNVTKFLKTNPTFQANVIVSRKSALANLSDSFGGKDGYALCEDISMLVDMFCYLFERTSAGVRLAVLDYRMCPKFHVDRVPSRLITTYHGLATEWLPHDKVNREKLGSGSGGKSDKSSGLYQYESDIQKLSNGSVAILKGELWDGNENAGLVHRSPNPEKSARRLLLTIDFSY